MNFLYRYPIALFKQCARLAIILGLIFSYLMFMFSAFVDPPRVHASTPPPPIIFWTDLLDGPNSGNSDTTYSATGGAYVKLYGNFFDNFTLVQLNGLSCLTVVANPVPFLWYEMMIVKIGTGCSSGNFSVTTPGGTWPPPGIPSITNTISNVLSGITTDFTVRSGGIFYVATTGNDGNSGTFSSPWLTMPHAVQSAQPPDGRIIYVGAGVNQTVDDGQGGWGALTFREEWSKASAGGFASGLLVYPGTSGQTIGSTSGTFTEVGLATTDCGATNGAAQGWWTIEGFTILTGSTSTQGHSALALNGNTSGPCPGGTSGGVNGSKHFRIVANSLSAPLLAGQTAVVHTAYLSPCGGLICNWLLGNTVHDSGVTITGGPDDQFHGIYNGDNSTGFEDGWNDVHAIVGCRAIQIYSNYDNMFDYVLNDNVLHNTTCEGLNPGTTDPSAGEAIAYNQVIYNTGTGPQNVSEGGGTFPGVFVDRTRQAGAVATGTVYVYYTTVFNPTTLTNNVNLTCIDTGQGGFTFGDDDGIGGHSNINVRFQNNISNVTSQTQPCNGGGNPLGANYFVNVTSGGTMGGTNNLAFGNGCGAGGAGQAPTCTNLSGMVTSNPGFVSTVTPDLHLSSAASPANGAGSNAGLTGNVPAVSLIYDHDGNLRLSPPAIGAYEYGTSVTPPSVNSVPSRKGGIAKNEILQIIFSAARPVPIY